ncbi:hypothetical protein Tco_0834753 [Tanacetum coccineum]
MSTETKLTRDEDGESVDNTKYRGMIGSLLYLTASRPDIMFSVCLCARFQEDPKTSHLEAVKCIFRYIKGTTHLGLWYPKGSGIETIVYADSDHAGDYVDRKSTSGVCTFMGCCLTSWFSKKQTALAISTTEAEYILDQEPPGSDTNCENLKIVESFKLSKKHYKTSMDYVSNDPLYFSTDHMTYTDESMSSVYGTDNRFVSLENQDMSPNPLEFSLPDIGCNSCYDNNGFESDNFMDIVLNDPLYFSTDHMRYTDESMSCVYGIENGFVSLENQDISMFNTCGLVDENQPLMKSYTKDMNVVGENMMNTQKRNHNEEMKVDNAKLMMCGGMARLQRKSELGKFVSFREFPSFMDHSSMQEIFVLSSSNREDCWRINDLMRQKEQKNGTRGD